MVWREGDKERSMDSSTRRTDLPRSPLDLDLSVKICYDLAHVTGCEPHDLHDLAQVSWVESALYTCRS